MKWEDGFRLVVWIQQWITKADRRYAESTGILRVDMFYSKLIETVGLESQALIGIMP